MNSIITSIVIGLSSVPRSLIPYTTNPVSYTHLFNSSLLKYGGDIAVGAMPILTSVMQFAMLPLQGLGQGAQPILSFNYGAKTVSYTHLDVYKRQQ